MRLLRAASSRVSLWMEKWQAGTSVSAEFRVAQTIYSEQEKEQHRGYIVVQGPNWINKVVVCSFRHACLVATWAACESSGWEPAGMSFGQTTRKCGPSARRSGRR